MTTLAHPLHLVDRRSAARWEVLAGALLIQLVLGTIYGYSVFWQPLERAWFPPVITESELVARQLPRENAAVVATIARDADEARLIHAMRQGRLKYAFGICLLSFAVAMVFAGRLQDLHGPRRVALVGGAALGAAFLLVAQYRHAATYYVAHAGVVIAAACAVVLLVRRAARRASPAAARRAAAVAALVVALVGAWVGWRYVGSGIDDRVRLLWGTAGLLAGVGVGFAYVCPIAALVKWFPRHKGLVAGLAVAGFGFGACIFSSTHVWGAVGFIERFGVDTFFVVHGLACLLAVSLGAALLRNPPPDEVPHRVARDTRGDEAAVDLDWRQLLRAPGFYLVWFMFFSGALAGLMVIGILKPFAGAQLVAAASGGAPLPADRAELLMARGAAAVAWLAIFNAVGRIVWGLVSDRIGRRAALAAMFVLQAVAMLVLGALRSEWSLAVGAAWIGFNFGGNFALFPSLTADMFGPRNLGVNYGLVFTSYGVAGVSGVTLGNLAMRATGSYVAAFAAAAALCALSAGLAWLLGRIASARPATAPAAAR